MIVFLLVPFAVALLAAFIVLFRILLTRPRHTEASVKWLDNFSLETYSPMQRLLDPADIEFLASQPGYRPEIGKRLMAERRKIFRNYLHLLIADFNQLIGLGKLMVVYGSTDRADLAGILWRQQVSFYALVFAVECKLALQPLSSATIDVRRVVNALGAMRDQIQTVASQRLAAAESA